MRSRIGTSLRNNTKLIAVAVAMGVLGLSAPAVAATIADYARNSDKVDGKHAVGASATTNVRKGKLVATSPFTGRLPNNIITKALDADKLDGLNSTAYVKRAGIRSESISCAGTSFGASFDSGVVNPSGSLLYSSNSALVRCNADLPDNALLTSIRFAVQDSSGSDIFCAMWRTAHTGSVGSEQQMASVGSTGTPGGTTLVDSSVALSIVDNGSYSYFLQCVLGTDSNLGLYGASVDYRITNAGTTPLVFVSQHASGQQNAGSSSER